MSKFCEVQLLETFEGGDDVTIFEGGHKLSGLFKDKTTKVKRADAEALIHRGIFEIVEPDPEDTKKKKKVKTTSTDSDTEPQG